MALIIGPILRGGMFMDGLLYTNISKNMAAGLGSFWHPTLDKGAVFYEHPPFLFWLESLFFKIMGDHLFIEDIYNLTILFSTIILMYRIWREIVPKSQRVLFFFPLLLWLLSQEVQLRYPNTMLECGMTVFLLGTVFVFLKVVKSHPLLAFIITGFGAFVAALCKGPAGLFVLALPTLYHFFIKKRLTIQGLLIPVLAIATCFTLLFLVSPDALSFFQQYFDQQVLAALKGERIENIADSRFAFLKGIIFLNLPAIAVSLILAWSKPREKTPSFKEGLLLISLGISAVLPLIMTIKQATYYQLPALPFLALGTALLLTNRVEKIYTYFLAKSQPQFILTAIGSIALVGSSLLALSMVGTIDRRDRLNVSRADTISRIMEEAKVDTYNFLTIGDDGGFSLPMYYPITGHLNRRHNIQYDSSQRSIFTLLILQDERTPLPNKKVVFQDSKVVLVR